jgi:hypothetical protein
VAGCARIDEPQRPGGDVPGADASPAVDASGPRVADASSAAADADRSGCPDGLEADLGTVNPLGENQNQSAGQHFVFVEVDDNPVQQLTITLHAGSGIFAGGVNPNTYSIEGDDADFETCSACVQLYAEDDALPYALFMAQSGKIVLDSVGATVSGRLELVTIRMIELVHDGPACTGNDDPVCGNASCVANRCGRQVESADRCETVIGSLAF